MGRPRIAADERRQQVCPRLDPDVRRALEAYAETIGQTVHGAAEALLVFALSLSEAERERHRLIVVRDAAAKALAEAEKALRAETVAPMPLPEQGAVQRPLRGLPRGPQAEVSEGRGYSDSKGEVYSRPRFEVSQNGGV